MAEPWEVAASGGVDESSPPAKEPWEIAAGTSATPKSAGAGRGFVRPSPPEEKPGFLARAKKEILDVPATGKKLISDLSSTLSESFTPPKELTDEAPKGSQTPWEGLKTLAGGKGLGGVVEGVGAGVAGAAGAIGGGFAGAGRAAGGYLLGGESVDTALQAGADVAEAGKKLTAYEPKTPMGKYTTQVLGAPIAVAKTIGGAEGALYGRLAGNEEAGRAIGEAGGEGAASIAGLLKAKSMAKAADRGPARVLPQHDAAIKEAMDAGYKGMPEGQTMLSLAKEPELKNKITLENQKTSDRLMRKHGGFATDDVINADTIAAAEAPHNAVYQELRDIKGYHTIDKKVIDAVNDLSKKDRRIQQYSPEWQIDPELSRLQGTITKMKTAPPDVLLDMMKKLRSEARHDLSRKNMIGESQVDLAHARLKAASAIQDMMDRQLTQAAKRRPDISPDIIPRLQAAREALAKIADVERYTNLETGKVNASKILTDFKNGKKMSGELLTIAKAARSMKGNVVRSTEGMIPAAEIKMSDTARAGFSMGAAALKGHGAIKTAGVLGAMTGPVARKIAASDTYQKHFVKPSDRPTAKGKAQAATGALTMGAAQNTPWRPQDEGPDR